MRFKEPHLETEFLKLHPELRDVLEELDDWSTENALARPLVTCLLRTPEANAAIGGVPNSYHLCAAAADLRNSHYSPREQVLVMSWLRDRCPRVEWELLAHNAGSGSHIHLARKDVDWRAAYENPTAPVV